MANLAKMIAKCADQLKKTKEAGRVPRSWLVTESFYKLFGKDTLYGLPVLNSRVQGSIGAKGMISDIILLGD